MNFDTDEYYISVDGGGSKTEFCVYGIGRKEERHFFSGSTNFKNLEVNAEKSIVFDGLFRVFKQMGIDSSQIKGMVMGLSGCDSPEDHAFFMDIAARSGVSKEKIYICNDCELAFFSEGRPPGLCINAGTGSIAIGIDSDYRKARSGGWGSPISDEGSGGWIGISVIRDMLRYCDGYGVYQPVFDGICELLGEYSLDTLPGKLSQAAFSEIVGFAKNVMDAADVGDAYCSCIAGRAAELTAEIAYSVYVKLKFETESAVDVIMSGSLFKSEFFNRKFVNSLTEMTQVKNINFRSVGATPVMGGIALAKMMFGDT